MENIVKIEDNLGSVCYHIDHLIDSQSLVDLNDEGKFTFKQIAYVVETWPQMIFKKAV